MSIVKLLLDSCASNELHVRKSAVVCLSILSGPNANNSVHIDLKSRDVIAALVDILGRDDSMEIQEECAYTLANLSRDHGNKIDIRKCGGVKILVRLLESLDPDVKKNVALTLCSVLDDHASKTDFRNLNGIKPLMELLASDFAEIQEPALNCLIRCSEDRKKFLILVSCRKDLLRSGGLKKLIEFISQKAGDNHHLALICIKNCLEDGSINCPNLSRLSYAVCRKPRNTSFGKIDGSR